MIVSGPSNVTFGPPPVAQVRVTSIVFDMTAHTFTLQYVDPASGATKTVSAATPGGVQASLQAHAQRVIEANESWANASSTAVTP